MNAVDPVRIIPAHDPSIQIPFEVPIKGRSKPLSFTVPRLQYLPSQVMEDLDKWLAERQEILRKTPDAARNFSNLDESMKILELLLPLEKYALVNKLTIGEKLQIDAEWKKRSNTTVGESEASTDSSPESTDGR